MPKPKSLTILGVRGLRIHERTPYTPGVWALAEGEQCKVAEQFKAWEVLARDAADIFIKFGQGGREWFMLDLGFNIYARHHAGFGS